jgi:hypothetical protein
MIALLSGVFILYELVNFINPYKLEKDMALIKSELKSGNLNATWRGLAIFNMFYFIWTLIGLFTPLCFWFGVLFLFSIVSGNSIRGELDEKKRIRLRRSDALISIILLTIILINYFK